MVAFRVERLRRETNHAFTLYELLGLVRNDYEVGNKRYAPSLERRFKPLRAFFGDATLAADIHEEDLQDYVLQRRNGEARAAAATIKLELSFLRRGYRLAVELRRGLTANDIPKFPTIGQEQLNVRRGFLTTEQVHAIASFLEPDAADLILFLYATAWRRGQAQALTWDHVDDSHITAPGNITKNGRPHRIPIHGEVADIIERRIARAHPESPYVFHHRGRPFKRFRDQWNTALRWAGMDGHIVHDLRRSAIKRMVEAGGDELSIMEWSGHRTNEVFKRYLIVDDSRMKDIADMVNRKEAAKAKQARMSPPKGMQIMKPWIKRVK